MSRTGAKILLTTVFIARGTSFLFSKILMESMSPMSILAIRFILAFLVLAVIFFKKLKECSKESLKGGLILGVLYTVCMIFEMYGLRQIDSGVSALIENMAIVMVPVYAAVLTKALPQKKTMLCAVLAVSGVGFLSLTQSSNPCGAYLCSMHYGNGTCDTECGSGYGWYAAAWRDGGTVPDRIAVYRKLWCATDRKAVADAAVSCIAVQLLWIYVSTGRTEISSGRNCSSIYGGESSDCQCDGGCPCRRGYDGVEIDWVCSDSDSACDL